MTADTLLYLLAALLILIGFVGTVLPLLPGLPLMFAGMLLAAWVGDFAHIGGFTLVMLGLLTALAFAIDLVAGLLGARRVGASRLALAGAAIGTLVGFLFGLPGLLLGPFLGAVAGELLNGRRAAEAARVGLGTWIGLALGALAKLALACTMLGLFVLALLF